MNAGVAKPIPQYLVYSRRVIDPAQRLLQRGPDRHVAREALAIQGATRSRKLRKFASVTLMLRCTLPTYRAAPLADQRKRTPDRWIGVAGRRRIVEIAEHRLTQGLGAAELWIGFEAVEGRDSEPGCGRRIDRPVRDQQRPGARVEERPRARPDSASAPGLSPAMVLQADSTTQSALSFNCATSLAASRPSSNSEGCFGMLSTSEGSARPLTSPATRPWVAK